MVTLEAWLAKMELTVADKLEAYDERIEKLESAGDELQEEMQSALNSAVDMLQKENFLENISLYMVYLSPLYHMG